MNAGDLAVVQRDLLRAALSLAARGWHVFPAAPGGKRPALRDSWQQLATTDTARIGRWWRRIPYNIAIACGPSGLVVLDLDVPGHGKPQPAQAQGPGPGGAEELARLCREHGEPVPDRTFTVTTPSQGRHLYFTAPNGIRIPNSASQLGPMIDIRAAGGYVIAPGSQITGIAYAIASAIPPVPLPAWLTRELARRPAAHSEISRTWCPEPRDGAYARAALVSETETVASAPEGTRNVTLNRAAFNLGQLVGAGQLTASHVTAELARAAAAAGLPEPEIRRTIRNGMTAGTRSLRHPNAAPPAEPHLPS